MPTIKLFVYGSLKREGISHHLLSHWNPAFLGEVKTSPHYELHCLGQFPAMVISENGGGVFGELYEINIEALPYLDRYEGVSQGLYECVNIELESGKLVNGYVFSYCRLDQKTKIPSGKWS